MVLSDENGSTLPLRITAIFVIMIVSALGCLFPLLVLDVNGKAKFKNNIPLTPSSRNKSDGERVFHGAHAMHLLKSFSAGIILCVGFVHVLAEANETLEEVVDFPLAFFVAMMGSIIVLALSQVVDGLVNSMEVAAAARAASRRALSVEMSNLQLQQQQEEVGAGSLGSSLKTASTRIVKTGIPDIDALAEEQRTGNSTDSDGSSDSHSLAPLAIGGHEPLQEQESSETSPGGTVRSKKPPGLSITPPEVTIVTVDPSPTAAETKVAYPFITPRTAQHFQLSTTKLVRKTSGGGFRDTPTAGDRSHAHLAHAHSHVHGEGHNDAAHIVHGFKSRSLVIAYMMEIGIVFHSVLIGIGLGVATASVQNTRTLLVAISVHQFFEGAGLSTCILEAGLERRKNAMMFALFSVTTSLGVCLGIGLSKIYDEDSRESKLVEGIFNALASGILIYLALVDILQEEFNRRDVKKHKIWQVQMMICVLLGAGVMSVIAIWA